MDEFVAAPCTTETAYLGECCRWDEVREELYWVDLDAGRFFRARANGPEVEVVRRYDLGGYLGALAPFADRSRGWLVALDQSLGVLEESGEVRLVAELEGVTAANARVNDGAADPWGRFWIGTMAFDSAPGRGRLFRYHESRGVETVLESVTISNGLGWSPERTTMYYVDSVPGSLDAFDVDAAGEVSNRRRLVTFDYARDGAAPDGLCVDAEGAVWVAVWGAGEVRRYAPSGEQIARVRLSTPQPADCAIGGANGTTLYVTTAQEDLSPEHLAGDPDAGRLFCVDVGVRGLALDPYRPELA